MIDADTGTRGHEDTGILVDQGSTKSSRNYAMPKYSLQYFKSLASGRDTDN